MWKNHKERKELTLFTYLTYFTGLEFGSVFISLIFVSQIWGNKLSFHVCVDMTSVL